MIKLKAGLAGLVLCVNALLAEVNVVTTIIPQKVFVEKIGGDYVNVQSMVPRGVAPPGYEPKPQQMVSVSKADVYFRIGTKFEEAWLSKIKAQNKEMPIKKMHEGVTLLTLGAHKHGDNHEAQQERIDPHSWMSPGAVKIMAKNILNELKHLDSANTKSYEKNHDAFLKEVEETDQKIKNILKDVPKGTPFMVFHPAFGYFAHEYGLKQMAIEVEGKEPKPKTLTRLFEKAKQEGIKTIIVSPEFSDKAATTLAKEIDGSVVKISPLNPQWSKNVLKLANTIAKDNANASTAK